MANKKPGNKTINKKTHSEKGDDIYSSKPYLRLSKHLSYGNIWLYILSYLNKHHKIYAYTLSDELYKKYNFKPNRVVLYLVLYKLEGDGFISSRFKERRKYYTITKKGKLLLKSAKNYLSKLSSSL